MTDILVERLRAWVRAFADHQDAQKTFGEAADEIERLQHMQANLHGHIKRLEDENSKLKEGQFTWENNKKLTAENTKLREALERIADSFDGETGDAKIARAALQKDEGE